MQQAAARRAVMAGAEGEAGLDLDSDVVGLERGAVVRAVDEEAPGPDRRQAGERIGDPVALLGQAEFDAPRRVVAGRRGDEFAQRLLVRREAELGFDQPRLAAARPRLFRLERRRRGLRRLETLDDQIGDGARALLVGDQPQQVRGVVGR
jgi:hypothetical protein